MLNAIKELSASVVIILVGAAMIIIGAANGLTISGNSIHVDSAWKIAIVVVGTGLVCFGVYFVWRDSPSEKTATSSSTLEIKHILRSGTGSPEHRPYLSFANSSERAIEVFWIDGEGVERRRGKISRGGGIHTEHTYSTHIFLIKDALSGEQLLLAVPRNKTDLAVTILIADPDEQ